MLTLHQRQNETMVYEESIMLVNAMIRDYVHKVHPELKLTRQQIEKITDNIFEEFGKETMHLPTAILLEYIIHEIHDITDANCWDVISVYNA